MEQQCRMHAKAVNEHMVSIWSLLYGGLCGQPRWEHEIIHLVQQPLRKWWRHSRLPKRRDTGLEVSEVSVARHWQRTPCSHNRRAHRTAWTAPVQGSSRRCFRILSSKGSSTSCWEPSGYDQQWARLLDSPHQFSLLDMAAGKLWGPVERTQSPEFH